jgi:hypothetical protein
MLMTVTDASGITAPVASVTTPWTLAVPAVWELILAANRKNETQKEMAIQRWSIPFGLKHANRIEASEWFFDRELASGQVETTARLRGSPIHVESMA